MFKGISILHQVEQLPDAEVLCYASYALLTSPSQMAAPGGDTGAGVYGIFERGQAGVGHSGKTLRLDLAGVCWLKDFHRTHRDKRENGSITFSQMCMYYRLVVS
jgi:hypothetical protein